MGAKESLEAGKVLLGLRGWMIADIPVINMADDISLNSSPIDELGRWCLQSW